MGARLFRQRGAGAAVGTHAVDPAQRWRRFLIVLGALDHGPALRRPIANLEPRTQHADLAAVYFDNCLKIIDFDNAVPGALAELEGNVCLEPSEQSSHRRTFYGEVNKGGRGGTIYKLCSYATVRSCPSRSRSNRCIWGSACSWRAPPDARAPDNWGTRRSARPTSWACAASAEAAARRPTAWDVRAGSPAIGAGRKLVCR